VKPAQVRMARAALNWSLRDLAKVAGVHRNTISNFETGKYAGEPETLDAIRAALEEAGIEFTNGDEPGVRMKSYKLRDAGQNAFLVNPPFGTWIGFGAVDAKRKITIHVQDLALQHLDPKISGGAEHVRAVEEHRAKIFRIAARKYELGHVEPGEIISVRFADVAG